MLLNQDQDLLADLSIAICSSLDLSVFFILFQLAALHQPAEAFVPLPIRFLTGSPAIPRLRIISLSKNAFKSADLKKIGNLEAYDASP